MIKSLPMIRLVINLLSRPKLAGLVIAGLSAFSLGAALTAQYKFGLHPCSLCLMQRVPYALAFFTGLGALVFAVKNKTGAAGFLVALSGVIFAAGATIAFYHHGVEQQWWVSALEGCKVTFDTSPKESGPGLLAMIEAARAVPCDKIPWQDPVLGWSMAAWNMLASAGYAAACALSAFLIFRGRRVAANP